MTFLTRVLLRTARTSQWLAAPWQRSHPDALRQYAIVATVACFDCFCVALKYLAIWCSLILLILLMTRDILWPCKAICTHALPLPKGSWSSLGKHVTWQCLVPLEGSLCNCCCWLNRTDQTWPDGVFYLQNPLLSAQGSQGFAWCNASGFGQCSPPELAVDVGVTALCAGYGHTCILDTLPTRFFSLFLDIAYNAFKRLQGGYDRASQLL